MPIYDNDGTANREIGKLYDHNGSANTQIGKVYDNNGSANSLIYSDITQIYPGTTPTVRQGGGSTSAGTWYATANPMSGDGNGATAYVYIGSNSYSTITMNFHIVSAPLYGYLFAGLGNFNSYGLTSTGPTMYKGYGSMQSGNGYSAGQYLTFTCTGAEAAGRYLGVAAAYRSSVGTGGNIVVDSIIAQ